MRKKLLWGLLIAGGLAVLAGCHANAATFVVNTTADAVDINPGDGQCLNGGGTCSLRAAIMEANASPGVDKIVLAANTTYGLTRSGTGEDAASTGDLDITEGVDIIGGVGTRIDANDRDRVFDIHIGASDAVDLQQLSLIDATAPDGGAVRLGDSGQVRFFEVEIRTNVATAGAPVESSGATVLMFQTTIAGNTGTTAGGINVTDGFVILTNVTVSGNVASAGAGGINVSGGIVGALVSTVTDNSGTTAGGAASSGGTLAFQGAIIAEQASGADCTGAIATGGYNIESGTSCGFTSTGDMQNTDPLLLALADNGGTVRTHSISADSPAVDAYPVGPCTAGVDGRLVPRPKGSACDIGAYEIEVLVVDSSNDTVDLTPGDGVCADVTGACTLRAAIIESNARAGAQRILFDPSISTVTLTRAGNNEEAAMTGDLDINTSLGIDGGEQGVTIDGGQLDRVIHVRQPAEVSLTRVRLTGGSATSPGGGLRLEGASGVGSKATLNSVSIDHNDATTSDGVFVHSLSTLTAVNTTIGYNFGHGLNNAGTTTLLYSTMAQNQNFNLVSSGSTTVTASVVLGHIGQACSAPVTSGGYNLSSDSTCSLGSTGDVENVHPQMGTMNAPEGSQLRTFLPVAGSPVLDAIPPGTVGCGTTVAVDAHGEARPFGGACDRGADEHDGSVGLTFVVNHEGDVNDDAPGDGVCQDAGGAPGACSLRAAIDESNAHYNYDTILFDESVDRITITKPGTLEDDNVTGDFDVEDAMLIDGGADGVTVDADQLDRVFHAESATTSVFRRLAMTGGFFFLDGDGGGGIKVGAGPNIGSHVTLDSVTVYSNNATDGAGVYTRPLSKTYIINSTIIDNKEGMRTNGDVEIKFTSVVDNWTVGIWKNPLGTMNVESTVVADNALDCEMVGTLISDGNNLAGDASCTDFDHATDQVDVDPLLGGMVAPVGSELYAVVPLDDSPIVDAIAPGTAGCGTTVTDDQHGRSRPLDGACEIGAVELDTSIGETFVVNHGGDDVDADPGDGVCQDLNGAMGDCSLRAALDESNHHFGIDTISFDATVDTTTLAIAGTDEDANQTGDLDVLDSVTIDGGPNGATLDGDAIDRVLDIRPFYEVTLTRVRITGGNEGDAGGGIRIEGELGGAATLRADSITVDGNTSPSGAGISLHSKGILEITNSTVTGNTGHGIRAAGTATIAYTTIASNAGRAIVQSTGPVTVWASILAGNNGNECAGALTSAGYNIVDDTSCAFTSTGDQQSTDPLLGALADNGGPTLTRKPGAGSPAINAVPNAAVGCGTTVTVDQRGVARPSGGSCDVGAVET